MKTRVPKGHIQYAIQGVFQGQNELIKRIVNKELEKQKSKWAKVTCKYIKMMGLKMHD